MRTWSFVPNYFLLREEESASERQGQVSIVRLAHDGLQDAFGQCEQVVEQEHALLDRCGQGGIARIQLCGELAFSGAANLVKPGHGGLQASRGVGIEGIGGIDALEDAGFDALQHAGLNGVPSGNTSEDIDLRGRRQARQHGGTGCSYEIAQGQGDELGVLALQAFYQVVHLSGGQRGEGLAADVGPQRSQQRVSMVFAVGVFEDLASVRPSAFVKQALRFQGADKRFQDGKLLQRIELRRGRKALDNPRNQAVMRSIAPFTWTIRLRI